MLLRWLYLHRTLWKKCCFSGDGEYIVAGSYQEHALYIWDKGNGSLVKILSGQKGENMLDVIWHPIRPIITSISNGIVHIWDQNQVRFCLYLFFSANVFRPCYILTWTNHGLIYTNSALLSV